MTILSCAAVSLEPLLKAHADALEALFASCQTLRLDSVKARVAGVSAHPFALNLGPWDQKCRFLLLLLILTKAR